MFCGHFGHRFWSLLCCIPLIGTLSKLLCDLCDSGKEHTTLWIGGFWSQKLRAVQLEFGGKLQNKTSAMKTLKVPTYCVLSSLS